MRYRELGRTGLKVSILSQGGAAIGQQYGDVSQAEVASCVHAAIDAGINLIDTSAYYGKGLAEKSLTSARDGGWLLPEALLVVEEATNARFKVPDGFVELERRRYDDTEFIFIRLS